MNRRDFLKIGGATLGLSPVLPLEEWIRQALNIPEQNNSIISDSVPPGEEDLRIPELLPVIGDKIIIIDEKNIVITNITIDYEWETFRISNPDVVQYIGGNMFVDIHITSHDNELLDVAMRDKSIIRYKDTDTDKYYKFVGRMCNYSTSLAPNDDYVVHKVQFRCWETEIT